MNLSLYNLFTCTCDSEEVRLLPVDGEYEAACLDCEKRGPRRSAPAAAAGMWNTAKLMTVRSVA